MFQHFPLQQPVFEHQFGVSALDAERSILIRDQNYETETRLRRDALSSEFRDAYLHENAIGNEAVREFLEVVGDRSDTVRLRQGRATNLVTDDSKRMEDLTLGWLGGSLQEDVAIMSDDASQGFPLVAGCVCFPSGWSIREKLGQSMLSIHGSVPEFERVLYPATEKLMKRMKVGRTVWRTNWGVRPSPQLDQSPRHLDKLRATAEKIVAEVAGEQCFFRVEFQTLTRVPSGSIVFTIRTEQCKLSELADWQRANLLGVLKTCPRETLAYKGIAPMCDALLGYLSSEDHA